MELEREVFLSPLHIAEREGTTGIASVCAIFVCLSNTASETSFCFPGAEVSRWPNRVQ
jgi:hypothetical protein